MATLSARNSRKERTVKPKMNVASKRAVLKSSTTSTSGAAQSTIKDLLGRESPVAATNMADCMDLTEDIIEKFLFGSQEDIPDLKECDPVPKQDYSDPRGEECCILEEDRQQDDRDLRRDENTPKVSSVCLTIADSDDETRSSPVLFERSPSRSASTSPATNYPRMSESVRKPSCELSEDRVSNYSVAMDLSGLGKIYTPSVSVSPCSSDSESLRTALNCRPTLQRKRVYSFKTAETSRSNAGP